MNIHPDTMAHMWRRANDAYQTSDYDGGKYFQSHATDFHVWPCDMVGNRPSCVVGIAGSVTMSDWLANAVAGVDYFGYHLGYSVGVNFAWRSLQNAMWANVPEGRRVFIAAHSRGGGQAFALAAAIADAGYPIASIVTFGAPGVYTRSAARDYPWTDITTNVVNRFDPIPRLAVHLHRPGTDIKGPGKFHRMKHYKPKGLQ